MISKWPSSRGWDPDWSNFVFLSQDCAFFHHEGQRILCQIPFLQMFLSRRSCCEILVVQGRLYLYRSSNLLCSLFSYLCRLVHWNKSRIFQFPCHWGIYFLYMIAYHLISMQYRSFWLYLYLISKLPSCLELLPSEHNNLCSRKLFLLLEVHSDHLESLLSRIFVSSRILLIVLQSFLFSHHHMCLLFWVMILVFCLHFCYLQDLYRLTSRWLIASVDLRQCRILST